jgi:hypothetical protein
MQVGTVARLQRRHNPKFNSYRMRLRVLADARVQPDASLV